MERRHPANLFVRDCITKALFKLMKSKNYHDITVSALVKTAGVSRNSFYRNYQCGNIWWNKQANGGTNILQTPIPIS